MPQGAKAARSCGSLSLATPTPTPTPTTLIVITLQPHLALPPTHPLTPHLTDPPMNPHPPPAPHLLLRAPIAHYTPSQVMKERTAHVQQIKMQQGQHVESAI